MADDFTAYGFVSQRGCWVHRAQAAWLAGHGLATLDDFLRRDGGPPISRKRGRDTVVLELDGRRLYLKRSRLHPRELLKRISRGLLHAPGAIDEARAALAISEAGLNTVSILAFGARRTMGVELASFVLMEHLYDHESVEDLVRRRWAPPLDGQRYEAKRVMLLQLADFAARFHAEGFAHRDFYLSHLFADEAGRIAVIDVQRVRRARPPRRRLRRRHRVKDLAQLYFSALFIDRATRTDAARFFLRYRGQRRVHALSRDDRKLIRAVVHKVQAIDRHTTRLLARRRARGEIPPAAPGGR